MTVERPDKSVSRYDKAWQEYANSLEQKLERLTLRLQEIENSSGNYLASNRDGDKRQAYAARLVMAQELLALKERDPNSMGAEKK